MSRREAGGAAASHYSVLRDRWYREHWFSKRTCIDAFESAALHHGGVPVTFATGDEATTLTVGQLSAQALATAAALQRLGVLPGHRIAVQLTNRHETAVAYQAALLCGAVLVPIIHIYGTAEVRFILAESEAAAFIMPRRLGSSLLTDRLRALQKIDTLRHSIVVDANPGDGYLAWSELAASPHEYSRPHLDSDDVCLLIYTSGTTSAPKGVQHSHNTILAEQRTMPSLLAGDPDDVSLVSFPPGHIAGVTSTLRPMMSGNRAVFLDVWNPTRAVDLIEQYGVTSTAGAPIHLHDILELDDASTKLASLREFLVGAAPVSADLGLRAAEAGIATFRSYGATEHPTVTGEHVGESQWARISTDGRPLPGSAVRILGQSGEDVPIGTDGEVVVQGPDQFIGYLDQTLDAAAFTADGWLRTGDLGHVDDSDRLTIIDRLKDVIIRAGETISAGQIEDVLNAHPAVALGVVVAAPDPRCGEVVAAVVTLRGESTFDLDELRRHFLDSGLARQKTPERLVIVDALPRTPLGKVKKADLRRTHFPAP